MNILVTGGAGYIGSHMVRTLVLAGHRPVVLDSLVTGHRDAVPSSVPFVHADIRDASVVRETLVAHQVDAVMHFAARTMVAESMVKPRLYWLDNVAASAALFECVMDVGVRHVIVSSTAAVYGSPKQIPIEESVVAQPHNPYGSTKLAVEQMLADYARAGLISYAALRYFNAAGAEPDAGLGERHEHETHLVPLVIETALGHRPHIDIYGTDWPTPDGTCVRDYVHVRDLASAHLAALEWLRGGGESGAFNLGTGDGYSVREIIAAVERVSGRRVNVREQARRAGDPAVLVASPARAQSLLKWTAKHSSLDTILHDAWRWHSR